jgi:2-polyprenyl-3-methyl-5-hydroxy-6-metoxy-1,4-benzoquinol methylase
MNFTFMPSPNRVLTDMAAFQLSSALRAAISFDLFTAIGEGCDTVAKLAERCNIAPRGARILADYLVMNRYLAKQNDQYQLVPESAYFLDSRSPHFLADPMPFIQAPSVLRDFDELESRVRAGGAPADPANYSGTEELWVSYARHMARNMVPKAEAAAAHVLGMLRPVPPEPLKVLDLAAGHGHFGLQYARQYPHTHVVAQDAPTVLAVATENARAMGIDHFSTIPGSVFDADLGSGYDVVVLANLLHFYGEAENIALLTKARQALKPGGIAVIVEFAPDDDRITPGNQGAFALFMLATTADGDTYTVNELMRMSERAGLTDLRAAELVNGGQRLLIGRCPRMAP